MIPQNEEHIEAAELDGSKNRWEILSHTNKETQEKYRRLEELIGEIDKLDIPFFMVVNYPAGKDKPVYYDPLPFHNFYKFELGAEVRRSTIRLFKKELLSRIIQFFGHTNDPAKHFMNVFIENLNYIWHRNVNGLSEEDLKEKVSAYGYFNEQTGLDLKP